MSVYAFTPRRSDPPHFVAEDLEELESKLGELVPGEQCDYCGNSCYEIVRVGHGSPKPIYGFSARCTTDPNDPPDAGENSPTGCGVGFPIHLEDAEQVVY